MSRIQSMVHGCYWKENINCARTVLQCLGELFHLTVHEQVYQAAAGLHGAGGYRAQCGLVEGALMFLGLCSAQMGISETEAVDLCYHFAAEFEEKFGSLSCYDLRPNGFTENDPPHACERLTVEAVVFMERFLYDQFSRRSV